MQNVIGALVVTPVFAAVIDTTQNKPIIDFFWNSKNKPIIEVHYECKCPDSVRFFRENLAPVLDPKSDQHWFKSQCDIKLHPYGKVDETTKSCQHG